MPIPETDFVGSDGSSADEDGDDKENDDGDDFDPTSWSVGVGDARFLE